MAAPRGGWRIERRTAPARLLHEAWPPPEARGGRALGVCSVVGPWAIVLGSTQTADVVDATRAARDRVDIVRRGSGGGAVLVGPSAQVWLDAWLPRHDPLWDDDVIGSSGWMGDVWVDALSGLGAQGLRVHRQRATRNDWSDTVCFAGLGPGEVLAGKRKVVGVAQRRTSQGARLHSVASLAWEPAPLTALLVLDDERLERAGSALADVATGIRNVVAPLHDREGADVITAVEDALLSALE
jgi:lipoate-protein ligase A